MDWLHMGGPLRGTYPFGRLSAARSTRESTDDELRSGGRTSATCADGRTNLLRFGTRLCLAERMLDLERWLGLGSRPPRPSSLSGRSLGRSSLGAAWRSPLSLGGGSVAVRRPLTAPEGPPFMVYCSRFTVFGWSGNPIAILATVSGRCGRTSELTNTVHI